MKITVGDLIEYLKEYPEDKRLLFVSGSRIHDFSHLKEKDEVVYLTVY